MPCEPKRGNRTLQQKEKRPKSKSRGPNGGGCRNQNFDKVVAIPFPAWSNEPSTSSVLNEQADAERAKKLLPCILYNDLIMRTIITNLPNFQDRINLEKTSRYFRNISSKAPWKFTKLKNHLKLTYYALDTSITLEHGNLKFKRPSMTLVGRRERADSRNRQNKEFLAALKGIAVRFGKSIKFLTIGGTDETARMYGIGDHQLIVTADMMEIILKDYHDVESLVFRNCGFDKDAVNYINNYNGPVFQNLKHLGLTSVWCDGDAPPYMLMRIIPSGLRTLKAEYLKIDRNIGEALMGALEEAHLSLEKVDVKVAHYFRVQAIDVQRYLRSLSRCTEQIVVRLMGCYDEPSAALIAAFQISVELTNLTGLYVGHYPLGRMENYDYGEAVRGLRHGNRLVNLSLNGWEDPNILQSLTTSLTGAFLLEALALRNLPYDTHPEHLNRLFEVLKVVHIELGSIPCMNSNHLRTICKKMPNLESLRLAHVPKVSCHSVEQCLRKWSKMEYFDIEIALSSNGIDTICNRDYLPNLTRGCFWMIADQQKRSSMEKLLQHFETVDCLTGGAPDRYCKVSVCNRRCMPLASISDAAVTYCHADHNPRYHEPLPPRERWDSCTSPNKDNKWWLRNQHGRKL